MTPPLFTHTLSIFVLVIWLLDSSHNLRMIHEGRTIVTILVSAARQSSASGKRLPGPAVMYSVLYLHNVYFYRTARTPICCRSKFQSVSPEELILENRNMPSEWLALLGGRSYGASPRGKSLPAPAVKVKRKTKDDNDVSFYLFTY